MKKVLFVANHAGFSKFNAPYFKWFKLNGWEVHNASPGIEIGDVDKQFNIKIQRNPFSLKNFKAYRQLKHLIDANNYDIIHVHTPMGAVLGRLAAIGARKKGTKVIYTAHGFHFFDGAPLINWIIYYPIERLLSKVTDALVTINNEDYNRAVKLKLAHGKIFHIDGVGVNLDRFNRTSEEEKQKYRINIGLSNTDFVVLYIAQFITRKNHIYILKLLPQLVEKIPNIKLVFVGHGDTFVKCKEFVNNIGYEAYVKFLGGRSDIPELCNMADIHLSTSLQEGLAIGNIEAMACGCALLLSNIRGHKEVCINGRNGYLFDLTDSETLLNSIEKLSSSQDLLNAISNNNVEDAQKFSLASSVDSMAKIYKQYM